MVDHLKPLLVALIALGLVQVEVQAQDLSANVQAYGSLRPGHVGCYQNQMGVDAEGILEHKNVELTGYGSFVWFGTCNPKISGSPLNAESTHGYKRFQGLILQYRFDFGMGLGWRLHREAVQWVWANPDPPQEYRGDWFPHDGSWENAEKRCEKGPDAEPVQKGKELGETCPAIGYEEGTGPHISFKSTSTEVSVSVPFITWKDLTYTPNILIWSVNIDPRRFLRLWKIVGSGKINTHGEVFGKINVLRKLGSRVSVGAMFGIIDVPDWSTEPFVMGGLTFRVY